MDTKNNVFALPNLKAQYDQMKKNYPDAVLLFRVGNFYETFGKDAVTTSEVLGLKLIPKQGGKSGTPERAGFPQNALDSYLQKLVRAGKRVAICELPEKQNYQVTVESTTNKSHNISETERKSSQTDKNSREPQMVTVNGQKVSHGHIFKGSGEEGSYFFAAKIDGKPLKTRLISAEDAKSFLDKKIGVPELMKRYHPSKLMPRVPEISFQLPNVINTHNGILTVDKFNVYKETSPAREDAGKYKMYAQIGDIKMSMVAPQKALDEYFDRVKSPGQLVEEYFGERLHLASAYRKYIVPAGVSVENIRMIRDYDGNWNIKAQVNGCVVGPKKLSYDDGFSFFKAQTASEIQLAAKYFNNEIYDTSTEKMYRQWQNDIYPKRYYKEWLPYIDSLKDPDNFLSGNYGLLPDDRKVVTAFCKYESAEEKWHTEGRWAAGCPEELELLKDKTRAARKEFVDAMSDTEKQLRQIKDSIRVDEISRFDKNLYWPPDVQCRENNVGDYEISAKVNGLETRWQVVNQEDLDNAKTGRISLDQIAEKYLKHDIAAVYKSQQQNVLADGIEKTNSLKI